VSTADPAVSRAFAQRGRVAWSLQKLTQKAATEPPTEGGQAMGFLMEVDVDEFLELMECETEARLRVAEIMERRRRSKMVRDPLLDDDTTH
jgi:hypothetical protein